MSEWEAIFLDVPKLYEPVEVIFRGQKCQTSHVSRIEIIEDNDTVNYRVRTMSGGVYVGPVGRECEVDTTSNEANTDIFRGN